MQKEKNFSFQEELPQSIIRDGKTYLSTTLSVEILADIEFMRQNALGYLSLLIRLQHELHHAGRPELEDLEKLNDVQKLFSDMLVQASKGEMA